MIHGFLIRLRFLREANIKGACRLMQEMTTLTNSIKQLLVDSDEFIGIKWSNSQSDAFKSSENKSQSKHLL